MWWQEVESPLASAYRSVGYDKEAQRLARLVRERFLDPARWRVFDDTRPALERLADQGWSHVIVSSHVPELADLVEALGLAPYFAHVVTSARVGYDKPHPAIFRHALELADHPERAWMIGDNSTLYFSVDDIHAVHAGLARRGITFEDEPHVIHRDEQGIFGSAGEEEWMTFFRDPAGNLLALSSRRTRPTSHPDPRSHSPRSGRASHEVPGLRPATRVVSAFLRCAGEVTRGEVMVDSGRRGRLMARPRRNPVPAQTVA